VAIEEDLEALDRSIRQLEIEWGKFFGGVEKKPPSELKGRVETLIRRYAYAELRNNTERFRYQTLTARYNTLNELWGKRLRALEEGKPMGVHGLKADALPPPAPPRAASAEPGRPSAGGPGEFRVAHPERDVEAVRSLFDRFLEARRKAGESAGVKFESFQKLIAQQASKILSEKGASAVDFRLETKDGKVSLKAKPVK
jgi:hypothetical protein